MLAISPTEAKVYYHPIRKPSRFTRSTNTLGAGGFSPARLASLKERFNFAPLDLSELMPNADPKRYVALSLKPIDPALQQHVEEVLLRAS